MAAFDPNCPYSGQRFVVKRNVGYDNHGFNLGGAIFEVEGWCKNIFGDDWRNSDLFPIKVYLDRINDFNPSVPDDGQAVYGKIGMFGYIFHITELHLPEVK